MQALGVDIQTIQSIVGHADTEMTEHYLHVQESIRQLSLIHISQPTHCLLVNDFLSVPSIVQAEQIFTVDKRRLLKFLGRLTPDEMSRVDDAVRASLALNPMGSIQRLPPIIRSTAAYAPPEVVDGKPPIYPYTPIKSSFEDAGSVEDMMLYTELEAAVHAMIQRLEYSLSLIHI